MRSRTWIAAVAALAMAALPACESTAKKDTTTVPEAQPEETAPPQSVAEAPAILAKAIAGCWRAFAAKDEAKVRACYADDATMTVIDAPVSGNGADQIVGIVRQYWNGFSDLKAQPQLTLVNGHKAAVILWAAGKNTGDVPGMSATGKQFGMLEGQYLELDAGGKMTRDDQYADGYTEMAQLGLVKAPARPVMTQGWDQQQVVIARNDDVEKANVAAFRSIMGAFNAHDADTLIQHYADDALFSESMDPADVHGKEQIGAGLKHFFGMATDVKSTVDSVWGAGDYVVATTTLTGHFGGTLPSSLARAGAQGKPFTLKQLEITEMAHGKVKRHFIFGNKFTMAVQLGLVSLPGQDGARGEQGAAPDQAGRARGAR